MSAEARNRELLGAIEAAYQEVVGTNERARGELLEAEGLHYLWRVIGAGLVSQVEAHDTDYPHFIKILSPWLNWGYPNPDGTYAFAFVHGDNTYRLHGSRGSARLFDVEVWEGDIADLSRARSLGGLRSIAGGKSEIVVEADGSFEIVLSQQEQPGNWIPLPPGIGHIYVRQWYYDYQSELPGQFVLERDGATFPRPPLTADTIDEGFERVTRFVRSVFAPLAAGVQQHFAGDAATVPFPAGLLASEEEGEIAFRNQVYGRGHYACEADEAVVLEVRPPAAEYWMFGLLSPFWESRDWLGRQISINGHQAVLDDDGMFRAVIAHRDPGVPNWLDAAGHPTGLIGARFNWTEDVPIPSLTTVRFDDVRAALPPSTPTISPAERSELLRRRFVSQHHRLVNW